MFDEKKEWSEEKMVSCDNGGRNRCDLYVPPIPSPASRQQLVFPT